MDDTCLDALAAVGWKVVPAYVRAELGRWQHLDEGERRALASSIRSLGAVLYPPGASPDFPGG